MRNILFPLAGAAALAFAGPALAQANGQPGPQAQQPADASGGSGASASDPNRMICARAEISGSRIARRVCRTAAEWEEMGGLPGAR